MHGTVCRRKDRTRLIDRQTRKAQLAAFDRLPRPLRLLIAFGPYAANPVDAENALRAGRTVAQVTDVIRMGWRGTATARARLWRKEYGTEYPYFAARATVLWTEPMAAPDNRLAQRRLARLRLPAPNPVLVPERQPPPPVIYL